jgi:diguanylate cyclase (GGDEF)-like protein
MVISLTDIRSNRRIMAHTAAGIYAIAGLDAVLEGLLPNDPGFSLLPVLAVFAVFAVLFAVGPRLPRWALALQGPLGVGLVAYTIATTPGPGDFAVFYALPVFWTTFFFGRRGAGAIIACVAAAQALALLLLPLSSAYPGRWIDVMICVCGVAIVVLVLVRRNELLMARLASEARTDALTGLLNRRGFDELARRELARVGRDGRSLALATLDIDHFKAVNDEWGHAVGDRDLAHLAQVLASESRDIDVAARLGGDEFAVLLPGSDEDGARVFTERVRAALASERSRELPEVRISAGVFATSHPMDLQIMLDCGDQALYAAKRSGRNRTASFEERDLALAV